MGYVYRALSLPALKDSMSDGAGEVRLILTVKGSTTVTGFFGSRLPSTLAANDFGSLSMRSTFHLSESAFHGLPSWNVTPLRRYHVWLASAVSHFSMSPGVERQVPFSSNWRKKSGS